MKIDLVYQKKIEILLQNPLPEFTQGDFFILNKNKIPLTLFTTQDKICAVCFHTEEEIFLNKFTNRMTKLIDLDSLNLKETEPEIMKKLTIYILDFFKGLKPKNEHLPILWLGTNFQNSILKKLMNTQYSQTITYKHLGSMIGLKAGCQAVGQAVRSNPVSILIPCHRVLSSNPKEKNDYYFGQVSHLKKYLRSIES